MPRPKMPKTIWVKPEGEDPTKGTYINDAYYGGFRYVRGDVAKRNVELERRKIDALHKVIERLLEGVE